MTSDMGEFMYERGRRFEAGGYGLCFFAVFYGDSPHFLKLERVDEDWA